MPKLKKNGTNGYENMLISEELLLYITAKPELQKQTWGILVVTVICCQVVLRLI